ncbi:hypothetical protein [Streptomyces sp. NPDC049881]|uniref:hypothetical protein n=1 Tax=Streptomyces sp. NPDC049881 TaxID=3155778 RepID=UPI00343200B2
MTTAPVAPARPAEPHATGPARPSGHRTGRAEAAGYAVAALILVAGGALLTSAVLNWLVGPAIVVACVAVAGRLGDRRRAR